MRRSRPSATVSPRRPACGAQRWAHGSPAAPAAPALVRRRWELTMAAAAAPADAGDIVTKEVASTGLGALSLYVAPAADSLSTARTSDRFVDQLIAILHVCQTAEEDGALL